MGVNLQDTQLIAVTHIWYLRDSVRVDITAI